MLSPNRSGVKKEHRSDKLVHVFLRTRHSKLIHNIVISKELFGGFKAGTASSGGHLAK